MIDIANMDRLALLRAWFPEAKFVHIVRDPRDVALSFIGYRYGTSNILEVARQWALAVGTSLRESALIGEGNYHLMRYEDLILSPEDTLRKLCTFIDLPYSEQMLHYTKMVDDKVPQDRRDLWPLLDQKPQRDKVNQWRTRLSPAKCAVVEDWSAPTIDTLGYERSIKGKRPLASFLWELWYFIDRGDRFKRLLK